MDAPDLNTASVSEWAGWLRSLMGDGAPCYLAGSVELEQLAAEAQADAQRAGQPFTGGASLVLTPDKRDWLWDKVRTLAVVSYPEGVVVLRPTQVPEGIPLVVDQLTVNHSGTLLVAIDKSGVPVSVEGKRSNYQPPGVDLGGLGTGIFAGVGAFAAVVVVVLVLVVLAETKVAKSATS